MKILLKISYFLPFFWSACSLSVMIRRAISQYIHIYVNVGMILSYFTQNGVNEISWRKKKKVKILFALFAASGFFPSFDLSSFSHSAQFLNFILKLLPHGRKHVLILWVNRYFRFKEYFYLDFLDWLVLFLSIFSNPSNR